MNIQRRPGEILIAVSGHRVFEDVDAVHHGIRSALDAIFQNWGTDHVCILTSLADGADRMVVEAVRHAGASRYIAVLPMAAAAYREDFDSHSASEFDRLLQDADEVLVLEAAGDREEAYFRAGVAVLSHADVLLAVWDGQPARGHGGTGDVVRLARECELPVAWVFAQRAGRIKDDTGLDQGRSDPIRPGSVTCERFQTEPGRSREADQGAGL